MTDPDLTVPEVEDFTEKLCDIAIELDDFKQHLAAAEESFRKLQEKWGLA